MARVDDALLRRMVTAIVDEADPEQVILFGSRTRGDAGTESDVDLVVIEAEPFGPGRDRHTEAVRLYRALTDFDVPTDILVYSRDEADYWRDSPSTTCSRTPCAKVRCFMSDPKQAHLLLAAPKGHNTVIARH